MVTISKRYSGADVHGSLGEGETLLRGIRNVVWTPIVAQIVEEERYAPEEGELAGYDSCSGPPVVAHGSLVERLRLGVGVSPVRHGAQIRSTVASIAQARVFRLGGVVLGERVDTERDRRPRQDPLGDPRRAVPVAFPSVLRMGRRSEGESRNR